MYRWTMEQAGRPRALWILAAVSFAESSVFPIPPDALMIPMILAAPARAWRVALTCTVASVLGGAAGYAIGALFYDAVAQPLLGLYGYAAKVERFRALYNQWGAWIVFGAGVTPFPYKVIAIVSGAATLDPAVFAASSALARGLRFFALAALLWKFGPPIRGFIERRLGALAVVALALALGGFIVLEWI